MSHGQRIRYLQTSDGVKLAWAEAGSGPVLVKAANWLTHLEYDWESPVWQHWIRFFAEHFHFVRYDERGCGMTDWNVGDVAFARWVEDLETVVDASEVRAPFALLGISQGASVCIAYAVRHPERVSRLILYGAYARGWGQRGDLEGQREYEAIVELVRLAGARTTPRSARSSRRASSPAAPTSRSAGSTSCAARPPPRRWRPSCSPPARTSR